MGSGSALVSKQIIYKICPAQAWEQARLAGIYAGSEHDQRDGYLHFSSAEQLYATYQKYFAGQRDLLLIAIDCAALAAALRWEAARDGALFPHLYGPLTLSAVLWQRSIPDQPDPQFFTEL